MNIARIQICRGANTPAMQPEQGGGDQAGSADTFVFASPAELFSVLTPRRWDLIERLQAVGPISLRGLGRVLNRDVKGLHGDAAALLAIGMVRRNEQGKLHVPYAVIHADFDLKAAA